MDDLGTGTGGDALDVGGHIVEDHQESWINSIEFSLTGCHEGVNRLVNMVSILFSTSRMEKTNNDEEIGIRASEFKQSDRLWQGLLSLKLHVDTLTKRRLCAHCLEDENAQAHHTLL